MADAMTMSQRADALEEKMARELDFLVVKSRLHQLAEGDMSAPPSGSALQKAHPGAVMLMVAGNGSAHSQVTQHIAARPPDGGLHSAFFQRQYKLAG